MANSKRPDFEQPGHKADYVTTKKSRQQVVGKILTLDSKVKTLHIQEKLNSNRNKNSITKTNISILSYVSQVFIL